MYRSSSDAAATTRGHIRHGAIWTNDRPKKLMHVDDNTDCPTADAQALCSCARPDPLRRCAPTLISCAKPSRPFHARPMETLCFAGTSDLPRAHALSVETRRLYSHQPKQTWGYSRTCFDQLLRRSSEATAGLTVVQGPFDASDPDPNAVSKGPCMQMLFSAQRPSF